MAQQIQSVAKATTSLGWPLLRKIFSLNFFTIVLGLFVLYAIIISVQQQSLEPLVTGVGGKGTLTLTALNEDSLAIIDDSYLDLSFWSKIWLVFSTLGNFLFILAWIRVFAWFSTHMILGDTSRTTANYTIGFLGFILIQIIFTLLAGNLGLLGEEYDAFAGLALPFIAFKNFVIAIPHFLGSFLEWWDGLFGKGSIEIPNNNS